MNTDSTIRIKPLGAPSRDVDYCGQRELRRDCFNFFQGQFVDCRVTRRQFSRPAATSSRPSGLMNPPALGPPGAGGRLARGERQQPGPLVSLRNRSRTARSTSLVLVDAFAFFPGFSPSAGSRLVAILGTSSRWSPDIPTSAGVP